MTELSFDSLLGLLSDAHSRLLAENKNLRADNENLRKGAAEHPPSRRSPEEPSRASSCGGTYFSLRCDNCASNSRRNSVPEALIIDDEQVTEHSKSEASERTGTTRRDRVANESWSDSNYTITVSKSLPALPMKESPNMLGSPLASASQSKVRLHDLWTKDNFSPMASSSFSRAQSLRPETNAVRGGDVKRDKSCLQGLVVGPNSKKRIMWDMLSLLVLSFDILTIPLIPFDIPEDPLMRPLSLSCTVFWTLDIVASLLSGFHLGGIVEMRPKVIAAYYCRRWLLFDLTVISLDWFMFFMDSGLADIVGIMRISKVVRMARIFRIFRLLRVLKMPALTAEVEDYIQSESLFTAFGIMRSLAVIAIVNHFIACGWYAVGQLGEPSWLERLHEEGRGKLYSYITALHWSLTQFTPASSDPMPRNSYERIFAIAVLFTALVAFSSFISSITAAMTQLRQANVMKLKQRENIRRYIFDNKLSLELGNRIVAFIRKHRFMARKRVHEGEIDIFKVLPVSLLWRLHWEVYTPVLTWHPLFHHLIDVDADCILEICHTCGEWSLGTSQELFTNGQVASKMYFILSGSLEYYHGMNDSDTVEVGDGQWCCEVALWVRWEHQGRLAALSHCEFVTLDTNSFRKIMRTKPELAKMCQEYAKRFRQRIFLLGPNYPIDVYDKEKDHDALNEMAQAAFELIHHDDSKASGRRAWPWGPRLWHTMSLTRKKTPPYATSPPPHFSRSHSMP